MEPVCAFRGSTPTCGDEDNGTAAARFYRTMMVG